MVQPGWRIRKKWGIARWLEKGVGRSLPFLELMQFARVKARPIQKTSERAETLNPGPRKWGPTPESKGQRARPREDKRTTRAGFQRTNEASYGAPSCRNALGGGLPWREGREAEKPALQNQGRKEGRGFNTFAKPVKAMDNVQTFQDKSRGEQTATREVSSGREKSDVSRCNHRRETRTMKNGSGASLLTPGDSMKFNVAQTGGGVQELKRTGSARPTEGDGSIHVRQSKKDGLRPDQGRTN